MNKYRIQVVKITEKGKHKARHSLIIYSIFEMNELISFIKKIDEKESIKIWKKA